MRPTTVSLFCGAGGESARRCGAVANLSHNQRQRTPPAFRDLLFSLVESIPTQATA